MSCLLFAWSRGRAAVRLERYGEIPFKSVGRLLHKALLVYGAMGSADNKAKARKGGGGGVFYDIGSGTGKVLVAAALLHRFDRCVGVEILPELHAKALQLHTKWRAACDHLATRPAAAFALRCAWSEGTAAGVPLRAILGDALTPCGPAAATTAVAASIVGDAGAATAAAVDWSDGDIVLCNSVLFSDEMYAALAAKAAALRRGAIFITFCKRLPAPPEPGAPPQWEELEEVYIPQTWGVATACIQRRL